MTHRLDKQLQCATAGEPAVRITIKGLLIFCSLIAGLIMAEVVAASSQNDSASPAAVGFNN